MSRTDSNNGVELSKMKYSAVNATSSHGGAFTIEEDDDVDEVVDFTTNSSTARRPSSASNSSFEEENPFENYKAGGGGFISRLTFRWLDVLLQFGAKKHLEVTDLPPLDEQDSAATISNRFHHKWMEQLRSEAPSLAHAFFFTFGGPFLFAGFLKFIHDTAQFIAPQLLHSLLVFLHDPDAPLKQGLLLVLGMFCANFAMSLCLRQYFWWGYRTGMNLRSSIISAVYEKALIISAEALSKRSAGEITNLMSVDSQRLQDLTPQLHAIWYSLYQVIIALILLWQQLGISCLTAIVIVMLAIPLTRRVSSYMKTVQKGLSKLRDERIKLTNEVLSGMKVIKLQAWEAQFSERILEARERELAQFRKYVITQAFSSMLFTGIPIAVSIGTFMTYTILGNKLDMATALTSLVLFELLRFPLFMFPQVLNNVVEAQVSVNRVQDFLMQPEKQRVPSSPLTSTGLLIDHANFVWANGVKKRSTKKEIINNQSDYPDTTIYGYVRNRMTNLFHSISCYRFQNILPTEYGDVTNPLGTTTSSNSEEEEVVPVTEEELNATIKDALLEDAQERILELERQLASIKTASAAGPPENNEVNDEVSDPEVGRERFFTLSQLTLKAIPGQLIGIVGQVGSGKSSVISALLGNLRLCYGTLAVRGRLAYANQVPFIQNSTLRENILYGSPYDDVRYRETLRMCCLEPDLSILAAGDMTEIGERGINLSGGQKARVGLARAVYSDADIYLLDDPLSAVDAHVGKSLFIECILHLVRERGKCVVLVTNALQYVRFCDSLLCLRNGRVAESGSYTQLMHSGGVLSEMIGTMNSEAASAMAAVAGDDDVNDVNAEASEKDAESMLDVSLDTPPPTTDSPADVKDAEKKSSQNLPAGSLMTTEDREMGDVDWSVYRSYASAAGGTMVFFALIIGFYGGEATGVLTSWWLSYWSQHVDKPHGSWYFLNIYAAINVFIIFFSLGRDLYLRFAGLRAGRSLFQDLLRSVLYAPMSFYDTTPLGRILNRFSKDVYTVDEQLSPTTRMYCSTVAKVSSTLIYICFITPLFIVTLIPMMIGYIMAQKYYIRTSRELTRIESTTRSPIYALFAETLDGITTISAFRSEKRLTRKNYSLLDRNQGAYFLNFSANCWLAIRLEFIGTLIVSLAALFAVLAKQQLLNTGSSGGGGDSGSNSDDFTRKLEAFAGLAGLSISLSMSITQSLNWTVRMASDLESQMISVERISSYTVMPQEASHYLSTDPATANNQRSLVASSTSWPRYGQIEFRNVFMRYRPGLPHVLRALNVSVKGGEKVGIVGRTGAGKSTILTALLRLVEIESGEVLIDGVSIASLGLNTLRGAMAVIPQDPVLFSGTIRSNLDPFQRYTDEMLWESLRCTRLDKTITSLTDVVTENGANYSVGQRQLVCISRALLSKAKIIIMDEATAAVDVETDALIQRTIRTEFAHATVLTVAHRLNTIMDSDKVLVMDAGQAAEFASPSALLADSNSLFYGLVHNWDKAH